MILESLLELVETLRARIDEHGDQLRQSEALTRYVLVDPLLRELGWNTEDPSLVIPEYQSGNGRADYALFDDETPVMMVEAKKLGTQLRDAVLSQGINYCLMEGTNYFSVTDGQRWEVYETHRAVPIDQKRVVEFDVKHSLSADVCLRALALWRPSVQSGHTTPGPEPVVLSSEDIPVPQAAPSTPVTSPANIDDHEWHPLTHITAVRGQRPVELQFPDDSSVRIEYWSSLPAEAVRWLIGNGTLGEANCPIMMGSSPKGTRYVVNVRPTHSNNAQFTRFSEVNGLYVETDGTQSELVNRTKYLIEQVGQDPAQFSVRFS